MAFIGSELATKYAILGRQAGAAETQANAALLGAQGRSALDYANAGQVPANAASHRSLEGHQGGTLDAQSNYYNSEADKNRLLGPPQAGLLGAQGGYYNAQSNRINTQTNQDFGPAPGIDPLTGAPDAGYAKGTANVPASPAEIDFFHQHLKAQHGMNKVPGKGPSTVDTVPAMLAPREAVLNEHAADLIGRDKIAAANAIGVAHQKAQTGGMVAPKGRAGGRPGYAEGTQNVEPGAQTPQAPYYDPGSGQGTGQMTREPGSTHFLEGGYGVSPRPYYAPAQNLSPGEAYPHARWSSPTPKPQKLAGGTHMVGHGKSAKTPSKIDPQALLSLMGAMQGGQAGGPLPMQGPGGMV